jgi:hypothetical protein
MARPVKERQLLLKDELVRASLLGLKHSTWRPIRPQPPSRWLGYMYGVDGPGTARLVGADYPDAESDMVRCPYGPPGDRLYVREAWDLVQEDGYEEQTDWKSWTGKLPDSHPDGWVLMFRADQEPLEDGPWRPSIYMPRWASRILFRVEDIEVRRLRTITLEEIKLDGIQIPAVKREGGASPLIRISGRYRPVDYVGGKPFTEWTEDDLYRSHFASGWDEAYAKRGFAWAGNPWCWYIKLKKLRGRKTDFPKQVMYGF